MGGLSTKTTEENTLRKQSNSILMQNCRDCCCVYAESGHGVFEWEQVAFWRDVYLVCVLLCRSANGWGSIQEPELQQHPSLS